MKIIYAFFRNHSHWFRVPLNNGMYGSLVKIVIIMVLLMPAQKGVSQMGVKEDYISYSPAQRGLCDLNLAIPDNGCGSDSYMEHTIAVSGQPDALGTKVQMKSVDIIVSHTRRSDLRIFLVSPNGIELLLVDRRGGSGNSFGNPVNCPDEVFTLEDGGTSLSTILENNDNVIGVFAPEQSLMGFNDGSDPNGNWMIRICDAVIADVGALQYVVLNFEEPDAVVCERAIPVGLGVHNTGPINSGNSASNLCTFPISGNATHARWYTFTPAVSGSYTITSVPHTSVDTRLSVHTGNCDDLTCFVSNDDAGEGSFASIVTADFVAGTTYYIEWDDRWSGSSFNWSIILEELELDAVVCDRAIPVGLGVHNTGPINSGNSASNLCTFPISGNATHARWYTFTPAVSGSYTITSVPHTSVDTRLSVHTGNCDDLTCFVSNDDDAGGGSFASTVTADFVAGTTYYIEWDNRWSGSSFNWSIIFNCINPDTGGEIAGDHTVCSSSVPDPFTSESLPGGHSGGLEYQWQMTVAGSDASFDLWTDVGADDVAYTHLAALTETTWFRRLARVTCDPLNWENAISSNVVKVSVVNYEITTTGSKIVITDICGIGETLDVTEDGSNIRFHVENRYYALNGGQPLPFPADIPLAGVTAVEINTGGGNDQVNISGFVSAMPDFVVNGGTGDLEFAGNIINQSAEARDLEVISSGELTMSQTGTGGMPLHATVTADGNVTVTGWRSNGGDIDINTNGNVLVTFAGMQTQGGHFSVSANDILINNTGLNTGLSGGTGGNATLIASGNVVITDGGMLTGGGHFTSEGEDITFSAIGLNTSLSGSTGGNVTLSHFENVFVTDGGVQTGGGNFSSAGGVDISFSDSGLNTSLAGGTGGNIMITHTGNTVITNGGIRTGGGNFSSTGADIAISEGGLDASAAGGNSTVTLNHSSGEASLFNGGQIKANSNISISANRLLLSGQINSLNGEVHLDTPNGTVPGLPAIIASEGGLTFTPGSTLDIVVNGAFPGDGTSSYTRIVVEGPVNLNNATLLLSGDYTPQDSDRFIIVDNDGTDAVNGTFASLPQGAVLPNFLGSSKDFLVSYTGGDGNDVVISMCINPSDGGTIAANQTICSGTMPAAFSSDSEPKEFVGDLEYQWQISTASPTFVDITGAVSETYTHTGTVTQTTWFRRLAKASCETNWIESNTITVYVPAKFLVTDPAGNPISSPKLQNIPFDIRVTLVDTNDNPIALPVSWSPAPIDLSATGSAIFGDLRSVGSLDDPVTATLSKGEASVLVKDVLYTGLSFDENTDLPVTISASSDVCSPSISGASDPFFVRGIVFTVAADPTEILADNISTSSITVTLTNAENPPAPVSNTLITVSTTLGGFTVDPSLPDTVTATTDANGQVQLSLQSGLVPGPVTVTALCPGACPATATLVFTQARVINQTQQSGFDLISEAVTASTSGDVLLISEGTYDDSVDTDGKALTLVPGNSSGIITITGSLTLGSGDVLDIEIFDAGDFDKFIVQGAVSLGDALLKLNIPGSYEPTPGATFQIIDYGSLIGELSNKNFVSATDKTFVIDYNGNNSAAVVLTNVRRMFKLEINTAGP